MEYFYAYHPGNATFYNRNAAGTQHFITNTGGSFFKSDTHHTFLYDGVTPQLFRNGVAVPGAVGGSTIASEYNSGYFYLFSGFGGGSPSTMQILEVIVYNKGLNTSERTQVWDYLTSRYGP